MPRPDNYVAIRITAIEGIDREEGILCPRCGKVSTLRLHGVDITTGHKGSTVICEDCLEKYRQAGRFRGEA